MHEQGIAKEVFSRYTITQGTSTAKFFPARLTDAVAAEQVQKRGVAGAVFINRFQEFSRAPALKLLWEVELAAGPPALLKPLKPKVWLLGVAHMMPGCWYQLL